jgi:hypothetical protein
MNNSSNKIIYGNAGNVTFRRVVPFHNRRYGFSDKKTEFYDCFSENAFKLRLTLNASNL